MQTLESGASPSGPIAGVDATAREGGQHEAFRGSDLHPCTGQPCLRVRLLDPTFLAKITSWKLSKDIPNGIHSDLANIKARLEGPAA